MRLDSDILSRLTQLLRRFCRRYPAFRNWLCPHRPLYYLGSMPPLGETHAVAIIPPSGYWVMNASLSVASASEALRYAAALFDLGSHYRYQAKKMGEGRFVLIAYDPVQLGETWPELAENGAAMRVTFAQWIFDNEPNPIRLNHGRYLSVSEGIVVEMDGQYVDTALSSDIAAALEQPRYDYPTLSSEAITPGTVSVKTLKMTAIILAMLFVNILIQIVQTNGAVQRLAQEEEALIESSHLSTTSIERDVVINALKRKEEKQLHLREQCFKLKEIPLMAWRGEEHRLPKTSAVSDGIVLIPGSKPGEANQLLIDGKENVMPVSQGEESFQEVSYEGSGLKVVVNTDRGETIKEEFAKRFKKAKFQQNTHRLEVRIP